MLPIFWNSVKQALFEKFKRNKNIDTTYMYPHIYTIFAQVYTSALNGVD